MPKGVYKRRQGEGRGGRGEEGEERGAWKRGCEKGEEIVKEERLRSERRRKQVIVINSSE